MIVGIGTDIVSVARIEAAIEKHGQAFVERILSESELLEYIGSSHKSRFLSKRFAAKEAFAKATGQGLRHPVSLHQISVSHDELGKPIFLLTEDLTEQLLKLGVIRHHLSISDERDIAVAFVVVEGN
jgi:holo-[acyl-carrier protein] synthase